MSASLRDCLPFQDPSRNRARAMIAVLAILLTSCASAMRPASEPDALERRAATTPAAPERPAVRRPPARVPPVGVSLRPPELVDPRVVEVPPDPSHNVVDLDDDTDYVIELPDEPVTRGLILSGGRNVVLIGGEIAIPWQGRDPSIASRTGLKIRDAKGTVHVEGLLLHGDDISEGIQIDAPDAVVQLQNVGVYGIHARDQVDFSDNHPDVIQTYGNVRELLVDGLTGTTDYQGLMLKVDYGSAPHGPVTLRNVDIVGGPTARYMMWIGTEDGFGDIHLDNVWLDVPAERSGGLSESVWPSASGTFPERASIVRRPNRPPLATWPEQMSPRVIGGIHGGTPPGGSFVRPEWIGIGYERPRRE